MSFLFIVLLVFLAGLSGTRLLRRHALRRNMVDVPNHRSSHSVPTPRGGGLAIVVASTAAFIVLAILGRLPMDLLVTLAGGGMVIACVGYLDDRRPLPAGVRIIVHFACAIGLIWISGGVPPLRWGTASVDLGLAGDVLGVFLVVWMLNLFNFMDGIDGIASSEAVTIAGGGAALCYACAVSGAVPEAALIVVAATLGFLIWNWPPAKIFMGDAGSGYLGYVLAALMLAAAREEAGLLYGWLILAGVFLVDATLTLVRRLARGERVYEAHRTHAYQWLARRWNSHRAVTLTVISINLLWLFPCAWVAVRSPTLAPWVLLIALAPLGVLAWIAGAGRRE